MRRKSGFTLVELLVVIAIIVVLLSILVPTLKQAKEQARRAVCLLNLRTVGFSLPAYAQKYHDKLPLFYHNNKQHNHWIWYGGVAGHSVYKPHWFWQGALYKGGALEDVRVLYCPSETTTQHLMYNTESNPWPVVDFKSTWSAYGNRPMRCQLAGNFYWPPNMPRFEEVTGLAVFSDWTPMPYYVDTRHGDGVNVSYADGSAHWVPRGTFDEYLAQCTYWGWDYGSGTIAALQDRIWQTFDEEH